MRQRSRTKSPLKVSQHVLYESRYSYLYIAAFNPLKPTMRDNATVVVTVQDANDNKPVFSRSVYRTQVSESIPLVS